MFSESPLVSVITVSYNAVNTIEKTIQSVLEQSYENIEFIIIDGGSTDGTVDIIKKYKSDISYWVSEKDNGIYEAMNKGISLAKGEFIGILNADDFYLKKAIELSVEKIQATNSLYSFANVKHVGRNNTLRPIYPLEKGKVYQEMPYPHISAFIAKKIYNDVGLFDESFRITSDHDMAMKIHIKNYKYCYLDKVIAEVERGGVTNSLLTNKEFMQVALKYNRNIIFAYFIYLKQIFNVLAVKVLPSVIVDLLQKIKKSRFR